MTAKRSESAPTTSAVEVACPRCGVSDKPRYGPGAGPHAMRRMCFYCGYFWAWVSQYPPSERQARRQQARQQVMTTKPPSERQLEYLRVLGHDGKSPTSMAEASALIDTMKRGKGGHR